MKAKIMICELPPEAGPPGKRLTVLIDDKYYETVLIDSPMTIECAIEKLELLAFRLKRLKLTTGEDDHA